MDAHIWPSLYPAIIVGFLVSLSFGPMRFLRLAAGAVGGLVGGAIAVYFLITNDLNSGPTGSITTMVAGAVVAWLAIKTVDIVQRRIVTKND